MGNREFEEQVRNKYPYLKWEFSTVPIPSTRVVANKATSRNPDYTLYITERRCHWQFTLVRSGNSLEKVV